jgi:hypothetical protein
MTHWHFTRTGLQPNRDGAHIQTFFDLCRYADAHAATDALRTDVVMSYPFAARTESFMRTVKVMPTLGECTAFLHHTHSGGIVQWRIKKCTGDTCHETYRLYERDVIAALTKGLNADIQYTSRGTDELDMPGRVTGRPGVIVGGLRPSRGLIG